MTNEPPEQDGDWVARWADGLALRYRIERVLTDELYRAAREIGRRLRRTLDAYTADELADFVRTLGGNDPDEYARRVATTGLYNLHDRADEIAGKSDDELRAESELYRIEKLAKPPEDDPPG